MHVSPSLSTPSPAVLPRLPAQNAARSLGGARCSPGQRPRRGRGKRHGPTCTARVGEGREAGAPGSPAGGPRLRGPPGPWDVKHLDKGLPSSQPLVSLLRELLPRRLPVLGRRHRLLNLPLGICARTKAAMVSESSGPGLFSPPPGEGPPIQEALRYAGMPCYVSP